MGYTGEVISLGVAVSWTITAILSEYASRRMGSVTLNLWRMILSLVMCMVMFTIVTGSPLPVPCNTQACLWMLLSGFIGYTVCDYCLMKCYAIIGSRFGQLFMTLAPLSAALTAWITLGQELKPQSCLAIMVTLAGIAISVLGRTGKRNVGINLPAHGVALALMAAICQGVGLVVSKIGMNHYEESFSSGDLLAMAWLMPFCANFFRCVSGLVGFGTVVLVRRRTSAFLESRHDRKGMTAVFCTTIFGPFAGVAFSLLALQYTQAGIASTLMAVTPIFILLPSRLIFKQPITWRAVAGAVISVLGVSLFFLQ